MTVLCAAASIILAAAFEPAITQADPAIPGSQEYEPTSYDTSPTPPDRAARVATPQDTALDRLDGEIAIGWWMLKNPADSRHSLLVIEAEPFWPAPRQVGQSGDFVWSVADETNSDAPQFPFMNGMFSLQGGLPGIPVSARTLSDGKPGLRSDSFSIDYLPDVNNWHVTARSSTAAADFTATDVVPGSFYKIPVAGEGTEPTNVDAVINSRVTGSVTYNGHTIDVDGWRGEYWRMNMFPSIVDSQLNPSTSWRGWEWNDVMEPDGGSSQYYGIINPAGRYSGILVDARPGGTRMCSKTTLEFGNYYHGTPLYGDVTPPFQRYTIPGWIKVKCAPGEDVQMEKTFYPDSVDYADFGLLDFTEMPIKTVPGSFGSYEHERYTTFRLQQYLPSPGIK
ncbi:hypothetical protein ACIP5Y_19325 [Nocardia sp. NPDC088792]|uniref:hypothetical protein n=1 Tax=Nocardia sp. NPDC088792 TaxID=3364332 RepID=UPI00382AD21B